MCSAPLRRGTPYEGRARVGERPTWETPLREETKVEDWAEERSGAKAEGNAKAVELVDDMVLVWAEKMMGWKELVTGTKEAQTHVGEQLWFARYTLYPGDRSLNSMLYTTGLKKEGFDLSSIAKMVERTKVLLHSSIP